MLKITPAALRFNPLDDPADFDLDLLELPPTWTAAHCGLRLCEGFRTLRLLPNIGGPIGFKTCWPTCTVEWADVLAQAEGETLEATQRAQNRVKIQPSLQQITRCEAVIGWTAHYLGALEHLCEAVNAVALAHALERDADWVTRKRGGYADTWRQRHDQGCSIIACGLIRDRVPVF